MTRPFRSFVTTAVLGRVVAVALAAVAIVYWPRPVAGYGWTFWAWLAAGLTFWVSLPRSKRTARLPEPPYVRGVLVAILILAAALRLWDLEATPSNVSVDEMLPGVEALKIAQGQTANVFSSVGWFTIPNFCFAIPAVFLWLLPDDAFWALRLSSVATGLAGIGVTFLLARRFFGSSVALIAAFLMSCGFWHLHNSRTGFPFVQTSFAVPAVLYLVVRARQDGSAAVMFAAGVAFGFALQLYFPVRILLLLVPGVLVVGWIGRRDSLRHCAMDAGLLGLGALFALAPLVSSVAPDVLLGRSQGVLMTQPAVFAELARVYKVDSVAAVAWRNWQESYGMFREWADVCILNRSPDGLFDPLTFSALALGVLVAIFRARGYALLFFAWAAAVFVLGVAFSDAPRASYRLGPAMPAFYILAAYGFHAAFLAAPSGPRWYRRTVVACLLAALATSVVLENVDSFFVDYAVEGDGRPMPPSAAMRYAGERCAGREIYFIAHPEPIGRGEMVDIFCQRHRAIHERDIPEQVSATMPATFIVFPYRRDAIDRLHECYDGVEVQEHRAPDRRLMFLSVDVETSELAAGMERCPPELTEADRSMRRLRNMFRKANSRKAHNDPGELAEAGRRQAPRGFR